MSTTLTTEFSSTESIILPQEVVDFAGMDAAYPKQREPFILQKEEKLFRTKFGLDFYKDLLADKKTYGLTAGTGITVYTIFQESAALSVGDYVLHDGRLYKVIQAVAGSVANQVPPNEEYFERAEKFASPGYEYLWKRYLRFVLAWAVNSTSMVGRAIQDTAKGTVRKFTEGESRPASIKEVMHAKKEILGDLDDIIISMESWIIENKDYEEDGTEIFANYKAVKKACEKYIPQVRHHGFNTNVKKGGKWQ